MSICCSVSACKETALAKTLHILPKDSSIGNMVWIYILGPGSATEI